MSREDMMNEAFDEGSDETILAELAEKDEVTVEDLRRLSDTKDYSDEELQKMWDGYKQGLGGEQKVETTTQVTPPWKPNVPLFDQEGKPIEDFSKLTVQDLFDKVKFGYKANDKDQQRALSEIIRIAQLGHHNEQRYANVISERNQAAAQLAEVRKQVEEFTAQRSVWDQALLALTQGNTGPIKALVQVYQEQLGKQGQGPVPGMVTQQQHEQEIELVARGQQVMAQVIMPRVTELATSYGAKADELSQVVRTLIEQEGDFLTAEKLQSILTYDLPHILESNGYTAKQGTTGISPTPTGQPASNELEELKKTVAGLQQQLADKHNTTLTAAKKTFPPSGTGTVSSAGETQPSFKNRREMKEFLQSR